MDITELLAFSVQHKASDLHLSAGVPPLMGFAAKFSVLTAVLGGGYLLWLMHRRAG